MNQKISKKAHSLDLLTVLAFLLVARISCPGLSNLPFFTMAFTFVYGIGFLIVFFLLYPRVTRGELGVLLAIALYTVYVLCRSILADRGLFSTDAFNAYVIVFLTVIYLWVKRQPAQKQAQLLMLILLALLFNYVYSIWVLEQDPGASRIAAATSSGLEKSPYDVLTAIGGFDAVYGGISVVAILICSLPSIRKGGFWKVFIFCILALALIFIFMAAYATALLLLVFAIALIFSSRSKVFTVLLIVGLALILLFHEAVGQWIIEASKSLSNSRVLQQKFQEFGEMLKTFEATGTYGGSDGRAARMQWSLNTFLQHPLLGGYGTANAKIGGHSELLDMLGKYGLIGFGLIAFFFISLYSDIMRGLENTRMKKCCSVVYFMWVVTAVLNPAMYSLQMLPLILMLPLADSFITNRQALLASDE